MMLHVTSTKNVPVASIILIILFISGIGFYEAIMLSNLASVDQLVEASSTQLSQFVRWYFWFMHLGKQLVFCVLLATLIVESSLLNTNINSDDQYFILETMIFLLLLFWFTCLLL